jgi:hypothetical protein
MAVAPGESAYLLSSLFRREPGAQEPRIEPADVKDSDCRCLLRRDELVESAGHDQGLSDGAPFDRHEDISRLRIAERQIFNVCSVRALRRTSLGEENAPGCPCLGRGIFGHFSLTGMLTKRSFRLNSWRNWSGNDATRTCGLRRDWVGSRARPAAEGRLK